MSEDIDCAGKRHYSSKARALRGAKALGRDLRDQKSRSAGLSAYRCDCGEWCVGHGHEGKPKHKRSERMDPADFTAGAEMFARAEAIAKSRYPNGANATQLAQVLREVLSPTPIQAGETGR